MKVTLKLKGQEDRVEDYLKYKSIDYERNLEENKTIFQIQGHFKQINEVALYLYTQFKFEDFIAIDEAGHAFLCW